MTIHWCGTGLSAIPGLRRLLAENDDICVWNRTVDKARAAVGDLTDWIEPFDPAVLSEALHPGDIVVSMLPGDWHVILAEVCIDNRAHFVSSSYISPEMAALDAPARLADVSLINEVGLDPGLDHLMAHWLVADMTRAGHVTPETSYSFLSYCGGVPKVPNDFRYKFSWSPLGVLKALRSPSRSLKDGAVLDVARPWEAISHYEAPLPDPESFEVYPNRDSLPFMAEYGFAEDWDVRGFVRGTLRLDGWSAAWADVFAEIDSLDGDAGAARLKEMSDELWAAHAYDADEPDRVILCVALAAERDGTPVYHKTYALDAWGDERGSAMARLVSQTVALAVEAVAQGAIAPGVSAAPKSPDLVEAWLKALAEQVQQLAVVDHLA